MKPIEQFPKETTDSALGGAAGLTKCVFLFVPCRKTARQLLKQLSKHLV